MVPVNPAEQFHVQVRFVCPFCKGTCSAGFTRKSGVEDMPAVLHSQPTCPKFDELEIDEFLHQVNIQYGAHN